MGRVQNRKAFTLIEMLISVVLISLVLLALYNITSSMTLTNKHIIEKIKNETPIDKTFKVLSADILGSDGNISIEKNTHTRLCMAATINSLYELDLPKVCWVVLKDKNTLARIEGSDFLLPTMDKKVEVDKMVQGIELFDVYRQENKILVIIKEINKKPISFMVQGSKP